MQRILTYINPLYLEDKKTKEQFGEWYGASKNIQIRYVTILTGILYIISSEIDRVVAPASILPVMIFFHLYLLPLTLFFISILTFKKKFCKVTCILLALAPIGAALANMFITINLKEFEIHLPEIYLIIIWTFTISGLRLSYATLSATTVFISVLIINYYLFPMGKEVLLMHIFWMFATFSFGFLTAFLLEKSNKIIFLNNKYLEEYATTDSLTGLCNRSKTEKCIEMEMEVYKRYKREFSVIMLDIDDFKSVNDTYGHHSGDIVLKEFSKILEIETRKVDIAGRWGGEEFIIVLPETDIYQAINVAENLKEKIETFEFSTVKNKTASFGVSQIEEGETVESIINRADKALYKAKNSGKNRVEFFTI